MEQASVEDINKHCVVGQWRTVSRSEHRDLVGTVHKMSDPHTEHRSPHIKSDNGL
jgi:hypothetical protein